jgi:hypothetical protein
MTQTFKKYEENSESGIALLIAIFVLLLITAIGAGMIMLTNTEINTSANFRDEQTAFFGAKAGIEEVRDRLRTGASNSLNGSLPVTLLGTSGGALYVVNPKGGEADTPWAVNGAAYPDDEVCGEMANLGVAYACTGLPAAPVAAGWYASTTASAAYQTQPAATVPVTSWKWTRVNLKTDYTSSGSTANSSVDGQALHGNYIVCWTGSNELATPLVGSPLTTCSTAGAGYLPVYVMTTLAVTPSGSRRMVQAETAALTFPTIPGAMVFDGSNPTYSEGSSGAYSVTGTDNAPTSGSPNSLGPPITGANAVACPAPQNEPAIGVYDASSVGPVQTDIGKRSTAYTGSPAGVAPVGTALGNTLGTVGGLEALVTQLTNTASTANINASSVPNPGSVSPYNPVINVVTGDLSISGSFSGAGILLVEGTLTMSGNPSYSGLILVIGKGVVVKNGGGNGTLDGSILVANLYDSSGVYTPSHLLPSSGAPGTPNITWHGGGNAGIQYDSCWSSAMSQSLNYRIVAVREMMK